MKKKKNNKEQNDRNFKSDLQKIKIKLPIRTTKAAISWIRDILFFMLYDLFSFYLILKSYDFYSTRRNYKYDFEVSVPIYFNLNKNVLKLKKVGMTHCIL